jgi:hypothetical protein
MLQVLAGHGHQLGALAPNRSDSAHCLLGPEGGAQQAHQMQRYLYQVVKSTFTFEVSNRLGTQRKPPAGAGGRGEDRDETT